MLLRRILTLNFTSLLVIALLTSIWEFSLASYADVSRVWGTAPGLPHGQTRVHHLALLPVVAALPATLDGGHRSALLIKLFLPLLQLGVLSTHVRPLRTAGGEAPVAPAADEAIDQRPLQVAGLACGLPEVVLPTARRPVLGATQ